jgi:hypothetical protein
MRSPENLRMQIRIQPVEPVRIRTGPDEPSGRRIGNRLKSKCEPVSCNKGRIKEECLPPLHLGE